MNLNLNHGILFQVNDERLTNGLSAVFEMRKTHLGIPSLGLRNTKEVE